MQRSRAKGTDEEKVAKRAANAARMKAKRAADKAAEALINPNRHDEVPSGSSSTDADVNDEISDYERLRLKNIQERNTKFTNQFGFADPLQNVKQGHKRALPASVSIVKSKTSNEATVTVEPTRKQPKRNCKPKPTELLDSGTDVTDSDTSFEHYIDGLIEASITEVNPNEIVKPIINSIISSVCGSKRRKPNIGRKTKNANRMAISR